MPKLAPFIKDECQRLLSKNDKKALASFAVKTEEAYAKLDNELKLFAERNHLNQEDIEHLEEYIKDTVCTEAIHASGFNFDTIEAHVLVAKYQIYSLYTLMFEDKSNYPFEKTMNFIQEPNSGGEEDQIEILRWYRMLAQYLATGTDNENEQLSKGGSKRKGDNRKAIS